ncbi:MAG: low affinity iron permease family protein [Chitinophagaceae bacterium]|nr:low affinity iron permease family protein [Chitinophagaceae bacterium]
MNKNNQHSFFDRVSGRITRLAGSPYASILSIMIIVLWGISGPFFHFSDTWQLVINTGTTIITFLMVFVIQQTQNKDTTALHLKLNELIACNQHASNRLVDIEDLSDAELQMLKKFYVALSELSAKERNLFATHSLDEAARAHKTKTGLGESARARNSGSSSKENNPS